MHATSIARRGARPPLLVSILTLASACASSGAGSDRGRELTQEREVPHFARLVVEGLVEVEVQVGKPVGVSVRADADHIGDLVTEVRGEVLTIRLPEGGPWGASARIGLPHLAAISCRGGSSARISGLQGGEIEIQLEGNGAIWAAGKVNRLTARIDGPGRLDLGQLATRDAGVRVYGSGAAEVTVSGSLDALVDGAGDVVYHGNPIVWSEITSNGSVSRR